MANGYSKCLILTALLLFPCLIFAANYQVKVTSLTHDIKDLSQRTSKILDQNGEKCALIRFETAVPALITFSLGAQQIEKRENKDDEVWIWVSADVKKITIQCTECTPHRDWRVSLQAGNVYHAKITTGLPQETSTTQNFNLFCEQTPFFVSIDGAQPVKSDSKNYYAELAIGTHELLVTADYYKPLRKSFRLLRSNALNDTVRLEDNFGEVVVSCSLSDLQVRVDEVLREEKIIKMEPGEHKMSISKDWYEPYESTINIKLGEKHILPVVLKPAFAVFNITASTEQTEIWIDGQLVGHDKAVVEILFGEHTVQGLRQGYDTYEYPVHNFTAESARKITIPKLNQQFGAVRLSVSPAEAIVGFDGVEVSTQKGIYNASKVNVGVHYVSIRMTDYTSIRDSFTVHSGVLTSKEYHLEHIPLGTVTIYTDDDIGIYLFEGEGKFTYLGRGTFTGKLPAGGNLIVLKNWAEVYCTYRCFIDEGKVNPSLTLPFARSLIVRPNVTGATIGLRSDQNYLAIRPNKKMKIEPLKYEIMATRKGYLDYHDSIDLSRQDVKDLVYHLNMHTFAEASSAAKKDSAALLKPHLKRHDFYDNAGRWYIGIIDLGYNYSFIHNAHTFTAGILPLRYKMFGLSLCDFEFAFPKSAVEKFGKDVPCEYNENYGSDYDNADRIALWSTLVWKPTISLVVPASKGFAFTFYGGAAYSLVQNFNDYKEMPNTWKVWYKDKIPAFSLLGGMSFLFHYVGWLPMNIFAEYRYPFDSAGNPFNITDKTHLYYDKHKYFRVGISFSMGIDR